LNADGRAFLFLSPFLLGPFHVFFSLSEFYEMGCVGSAIAPFFSLSVFSSLSVSRYGMVVFVAGLALSVGLYAAC
jgi:hypothetical protein